PSTEGIARAVDLIDVHSHIVPERFPDNPSPATNSRWPCTQVRAPNDATVVIADKPFREIDSRSWDVARRIEDMDRDRITLQALSPMPELLSYWFTPTDGLEMARWMNHTIASMIAAAPARFAGLGTVPLQDPALAATELARLQRDGLRGVELGSNINGVVLGDRRFDEFYAEAQRLDLALFVHALHPIGTDRLQAFPDLIPFAAFPLDTALAAISLIRAGVPERFPNLRIGFSHGGGAIVALTHRLQQGWRLSDGFGGALPRTPLHYARRFYYDSLVYDPGYLRYLTTQFAPGQCFAGTDYPYAIMQTRLHEFLLESEPPAGGSLMHGAARRFLGASA
ncbi:MAG TPA: amidohydrolase family protein, partial [Pseudomonadales bacterium]